LTSRGNAWALATFALARGIGQTKTDPFQKEAQFLLDAVDATVQERWSIRHEKLTATLAALKASSLADINSAIDESRNA
jgi:hypothetical protein